MGRAPEQGLFLGLGVVGFLVRRGVGGFILARILGFGCLVSLVLLGGCGLGRGPRAGPTTGFGRPGSAGRASRQNESMSKKQ